MLYKIYFFLGQYLFCYYTYNFVNPRTLFGTSVRKAFKNEFPFVVPIMKINSANPDPQVNYVCSGTLFSPRDILTSELCLYQKNPEGMYIVVGSPNLNLGTKYYMYWSITYDHWVNITYLSRGKQDNEIAVIRLLEDISTTIKPALLTTFLNHEHYGLRVEGVGWGSKNQSYSNVELQTVFLKVIPNSDCKNRTQKLYSNKSYVEHSELLCSVGNPQALLSWGDIGGPLLYYNVIIGINRGVPAYVVKNDQELVNYHLGIFFYRRFIISVKNYV